MARHNLYPVSTLGIALISVGLGGLLGPAVWAQLPDEDFPAVDSPDSGDRPRGDRGGRFSRGGGRGGAEGVPGTTPGEDRRGGRGRRDDAGAGAPPAGNAAPGQPGAKPKVRVGRVGRKPPPPAALPAQYVARDTNRDGQIGMYEWSRSDLATFNRLDTNRDGFLVPAELINPGSGAGGAVVASPSTASAVPAATGSVPTASPSAPVQSAATGTPAAASASSADPKVAAAESAFDFLDSSGAKDGVLSAEEWERSRNARKLFTDAKVEIQLPLTKAKFVENYVKLSK